MKQDFFVIDGFVPFGKILKTIKRKYADAGLKYGWKASNELAYDFGHWNKEIVRNSKYFKYDLSELPEFKNHPEVSMIWDLIKQRIGDRVLVRCYINGYTYGTDGYAHLDDTNITNKFGEDALSETAVIYLNEKWDRDWAGETVIFEGDEVIKSVLPKANRVLIFNSALWHAARPLARCCPSLRLVLVFKTGAKRINDNGIAFIKPLTENIRHSGRTFFEHLYGTMRRLEEYKCSKNVCAAGLFHSIYGTEYFNANLGITREVVRKLIGSYAEYLVYEFCIMRNRLDTMLLNTNKYPKNVLIDLMMIEVANLEDQNTNGKSTKKINQLKEAVATLKENK